MFNLFMQIRKNKLLMAKMCLHETMSSDVYNCYTFTIVLDRFPLRQVFKIGLKKKTKQLIVIYTAS